MLRRAVVAFLLCVLPLAARGTEVPLAPPADGPSPMTIVGAVPHGDGFFVVTRAYSGNRTHVFGVRVGATGELLGAPVLLDSREGAHSRSYALRTENGRPHLEVMTAVPDGPVAYDYIYERLALDLENVRVRGSETTRLDYWVPFIPKNARGETLALHVENNAYSNALWFVGADGVRRRVINLPELGSLAITAVPYGEDEWLLVSPRDGGIVWYRISEANRSNPRSLVADVVVNRSSQWRQTIATADGEFAILTEDVASTGVSSQYRRTLTLRVIRPDGTSNLHTLIAGETLSNPVTTPVYPATAALSKDGDTWLVAFSWWDTTGANELRLWRVASQATLTKHDSYVDRRDKGAMAPVLVSGLTHNLLLFSKPTNFDDRTAPARHAHAWGRGSGLPAGDSAKLFMPAAPRQSEPGTAAGPAGIMAVWSENETDSYARFFAADGTGGEPVRLTSPFFAGRRPVVARNGDTFAVAWLEWRQRPDWAHSYDRQRVLVRRFDARGNALDAEPLVLWDRTSQSNMPDTPGLAIGAETDGFRVAWHGRSLEALANRDQPEQTIYTTHIGSSGTRFAEPGAITPNYVRAAEPAIVSDGADSLLIYKQGVSGTFDWYQQSTVDLYAQRYIDGVARGATIRLTRGSKFAAAAHTGELLLANARFEGQGYCTDAQRFSFTGAALSPVVTLDCRSGGDIAAARPSVVWDNGHWWVAPAAPELAYVHRLNADGTPREPVRFFDEETPSLATSLVATGRNPSAVYVRVDPALAMVERAFLRTFPRPRTRAVRH